MIIIDRVHHGPSSGGGDEVHLEQVTSKGKKAAANMFQGLSAEFPRCVLCQYDG